MLIRLSLAARLPEDRVDRLRNSDTPSIWPLRITCGVMQHSSQGLHGHTQHLAVTDHLHSAQV